METKEKPNFTLSLMLDQTAIEVFEAILNVRKWWSGYYAEEIEGNYEKINDEFSFRAAGGAHYSHQRVVEIISASRIVWLITESDFSNVDKRDEWTGTKVVFEIMEQGDKTQLRFTHEGLNPDLECYDSCAQSWSRYLQNRLLLKIENELENP